ncbi:unnamed protein product (macronuclear) [Paramecium tetraurelia]|uniref:Transmembrane protein n=1 Tax=Paramecium tetraurelia TaxID=5888 RepID=A0E0T7_PARTE|nr:uncharacterized protein GSPATT00022072001 [Paramecium tetraurelia]CAK88904.1 unnamed protein product [Paramecium tetraurelia]|eukprot:XP_001456301.1 hypothetical protein (macronuclear) [Paramecium tetraurelia strain d4-2]
MDFKTWIEQKATKTFIIIIVIQMTYLASIFIADVILNLNYSGNDNNNPQDECDWSLDDYYKWAVLFLFQIGDCYYVFNAIYKSNVLELFAYIIISFITFLCTFARFFKPTSYFKSSNTDEGDKVLAAFDYVYLFYSFCVFVLSAVCYKPFYDVFVYRNIMKVGASPKIQDMFRNYSNFSIFMQLYLLISFSTFLTFFFFFDRLYWYLYLIDSFVILFQIASIFIGYWALKEENIKKFWMYISMILLVQLYILTKTSYYMIYYYNQKNSKLIDDCTLQDTPYGDSYTVVIVIGTTIACLVIMIFDGYYAYQCKLGFGNGLKEALKSQISETGQELGESSFSTQK